jgi:hypothetical protein
VRHVISLCGVATYAIAVSSGDQLGAQFHEWPSVPRDETKSLLSQPHSGIGGRTPDERYRRTPAACRRPRFEPRARWPRDSLCAEPQAKVRGRCGEEVELVVDFLQDRRHLPVVMLKRAAYGRAGSTLPLPTLSLRAEGNEQLLTHPRTASSLYPVVTTTSPAALNGRKTTRTTSAQRSLDHCSDTKSPFLILNARGYEGYISFPVPNCPVHILPLIPGANRNFIRVLFTSHK